MSLVSCLPQGFHIFHVFNQPVTIHFFKLSFHFLNLGRALARYVRFRGEVSDSGLAIAFDTHADVDELDFDGLNGRSDAESCLHYFIAAIQGLREASGHIDLNFSVRSKEAGELL